MRRTLLLGCLLVVVSVQPGTGSWAHDPTKAIPDPGTLSHLRNAVGKSFRIRVTGVRDGGSVWGSDIYTDDSALARAAVHAGFLKDGQRGVLKVTILAGQNSYQSSTRNGITTSAYGVWGGSYRIDGVEVVRVPKGKHTFEVLPDPVTLTGYRGKNGQSYYFEVTGNSNGGTVWGSDVYTDDSSLARAAVHAGILKNGEKGVVKVTILPGQIAYIGSTRNGIETSPYGAWEGSYVVEAVKEK